MPDDSPNLNDLMSKPDWGKLSPQARQIVIDRQLPQMLGWEKMSPQGQMIARQRFYEKGGVHLPSGEEQAKPLSTGEAIAGSVAGEAMGRDPRATVGVGEDALRMGAFTAGEAAGTALGVPAGVAATAATAPVLGPVAPVAGFATEQVVRHGVTGAAVTGMDAAIAKFNHWMYNTPDNLNVKTDFAENVGGSVLAGVGGKVLGKVSDAVTGKPGLIAAAKEEAGKGTAAATKVAEKAQGEATAATDKITAAQTAQFKAAQKADAKLDVARRDATSDAQQKMGSLEDDVTQRLHGDARHQAIQESLTHTPEETERLRTLPAEDDTSLPGLEQTQQQQDLYRNVSGNLNRAGQTWAAKRDKLLGPYLDQGIDSSPLQNSVAEEEQWAKANNRSFSPAVKKLFLKAQTLEAPEAEGTVVDQQGELPGGEPYNAKDFPGEAKLDTGGGKLVTLKPMPTVRAHLGLRSEASALAASATNGIDRHAAGQIVDGVDATLAQIDTPSLKPLNAQYRAFKTIFPRSFTRAMSSTDDPVKMAPDVFNDPRRARNLVTGATPDERKYFASWYSDWVNREGDKVVKPQHADFLKDLFPGTPLANPKSWVYLDKALVKFDDVVKTSPGIRQVFTTARDNEAREIQQDAAAKIVKAAQDRATAMGPAGEQLKQAIAAAKDPIQAAEAATKAITGSDTRAALASIQSGKMGGANMDFIKRRFPIYAAFSIGAAMLGRTPSPFIGGMAMLGAAMTGGESFRSLFLKDLADNPDKAKALWDAAINPVKDSSMKYFAKAATRAAVATATTQLFKASQGDPLQSGAQPAPAPEPTMDNAPLQTVGGAWDKAMQENNPKEAKRIATIMAKRIKGGEWKALSPQQRTTMGPVIRRMFGPSTATERQVSAGT